MPEILLFDIFEPRISNGMSTDDVYPSIQGFFLIVLPQEKIEKYIPKESISCNFRPIYFSFPFYSCALFYTCQ